MHPQQAVTRQRRARARRARRCLLRWNQRAGRQRFVAAAIPVSVELSGAFAEVAEAAHNLRDQLGPPDWWEGHRRRQLDARASRESAARLLERTLTRTQWDDLRTHGYFDVIGSRGREVYRLDCYPPGNIIRHSDRAKLCVAHPGHASVAALLVCQTFQITHDERAFLAVANYLGPAPRLQGTDGFVIAPSYHIDEVCYPERCAPRAEAQPRPASINRRVVLPLPPSVPVVGVEILNEQAAYLRWP